MEIWDIWAKMGPFGAPGGPEGTQYQVKVSGDHESNPAGQLGAVGTKMAKTGPFCLFLIVFSSWVVLYGL